MADLTDIEQKALAALDNESIECTKAERDAFVYQVRAYRNAAVYADQWGLDVTEFKATLTRLTGVTDADMETL